MATTARPRIGGLEMKILNVLWHRGPSTVREVLEDLRVKPTPVYTTVLTIMRLMHEKGYLERRENGRAHIYRPLLQEQRVKRGLLREVIDGAFHGSAEALMVRLLEDEELSSEELQRIKKVITQKEREG